MSVIDDAIQADERMRELTGLRSEITLRRRNSETAKEYIERICQEKGRSLAEEWLREKGL